MIHSGGEEGKRQRGRRTKKKGQSRYSCRSCIAHRQTETRSRSVHATHVETPRFLRWDLKRSKEGKRAGEKHKRRQEYEGEEGEDEDEKERDRGRRDTYWLGRGDKG